MTANIKRSFTSTFIMIHNYRLKNTVKYLMITNNFTNRYVWGITTTGLLTLQDKSDLPTLNGLVWRLILFTIWTCSLQEVTNLSTLNGLTCWANGFTDSYWFSKFTNTTYMTGIFLQTLLEIQAYQANIDFYMFTCNNDTSRSDMVTAVSRFRDRSTSIGQWRKIIVLKGKRNGSWNWLLRNITICVAITGWEFIWLFRAVNVHTLNFVSLIFRCSTRCMESLKKREQSTDAFERVHPWSCTIKNNTIIRSNIKKFSKSSMECSFCIWLARKNKEWTSPTNLKVKDSLKESCISYAISETENQASFKA